MSTTLTEEQLAELQESFEIFDKNNDGTITPAELNMLLKNMNKKCTHEAVNNMIDQMDKDGNGKIDFNEFVQHAKSVKKTKTDLERAFNEFDQDGNGFVTEEELHNVMQKLGQGLNMEHIQQMIASADKDGDGRVDYKEFIRLMTKK